jgi:hypothetical protein
MSEKSKKKNFNISNTLCAIAWINNLKFVFSVWFEESLYLYDYVSKEPNLIKASTYYTALSVYKNFCLCGGGGNLTIDVLNLDTQEIKEDAFNIGEICETIISDISVMEKMAYVLCKSKKKCYILSVDLAEQSVLYKIELPFRVVSYRYYKGQYALIVKKNNIFSHCVLDLSNLNKSKTLYIEEINAKIDNQIENDENMGPKSPNCIAISENIIILGNYEGSAYVYKIKKNSMYSLNNDFLFLIHFFFF